MKSKVAFILIQAVLFLVPFSILQAQDENSSPAVTNQLWLDFNIGWKFSKQFELKGKVGAMTIWPNEWNKLYSNAEVSYWIPKIRFMKVQYDERVYLGVDYYSIFFVDQPNVIEISTYQGYTQTWPKLRRFAMRNNFELGQRFQWDVEEWNYSFGLKLSYEASMIFNFHGDVWRYGEGFFLSVSVKLWWNLIATTVFNDVMRITPGIGYQINPKWKTACYIGYNLNRNQSIDRYQTNNIIYRIRVYYTIPNKFDN